jgi:hypothetical protein
MHSATKRNCRLCDRRLLGVTATDLVVNVSFFWNSCVCTKVGGEEDCGFMA